MRFKLRPFLLASTSLLALQIAVAQPVSTANAATVQPVTLEQGLNLSLIHI